mmetsp:Transcript_13757/g.21851  ORF Transcript_13757/g.21851 Transcript_13757/m.21851 type:complete len:176 (-) Transcript_13757:147-674(-)
MFLVGFGIAFFAESRIVGWGLLALLTLSPPPHNRWTTRHHNSGGVLGWNQTMGKLTSNINWACRYPSDKRHSLGTLEGRALTLHGPSPLLACGGLSCAMATVEPNVIDGVHNLLCASHDTQRKGCTHLGTDAVITVKLLGRAKLCPPTPPFCPISATWWTRISSEIRQKGVWAAY